ncbi:ankyrin repeat-containing domain protein [Zopfochytrium polystomum]|nr:ankyrin repeat-containing domain protein [Zopfochytrium polystomum]
MKRAGTVDGLAHRPRPSDSHAPNHIDFLIEDYLPYAKSEEPPSRDSKRQKISHDIDQSIEYDPPHDDMESPTQHQDSSETASLHEAAARGMHDRIQALIAAGADVAAVNADGLTLFDAAVREWQIELVLLEGGAAVDEGIQPTQHQKQTVLSLRTVTDGLCLAARFGRCDLVEPLIRFGASVDGRQCDGDPSATHAVPLHIACANGHSDVVRLLLERGADVTFSIF